MEETAPEPRFLKTKNGRIAWWICCEEGCRDNIPAVLVHGGPGDGCDPLKGPRMALGRPVYQYDQLGCGSSDPIPDPDSWTADDYAEELAEFLDGVGIGKCILIGASWGAGLICSYIASHGTSRIAALVLPSPFLSSEIWVDDMVTNLKSMSEGAYPRLMECIHGRGPEEDITKIMGEYNSRFLFSKPINREIALACASDGPNPVFAKMWGPNEMVCTGTLHDFDVTDVLPSIDVPVLYMCGDSDEVTIPTAMMYRDSTPGSALSIVQDAGHALSFEQFDIYRQCILSFLSDRGL